MNIDKQRMTKDKQIDLLVDKLNISIQEANEILEYDRLVDTTADFKEGNAGVLPKDKQKEIKEYTNTKKGATGKQVNKKANSDKLRIMDLIQQTLQNAGISYSVENAERIIILQLNGNEYRLTLAKKTK